MIVITTNYKGVIHQHHYTGNIAMLFDGDDLLYISAVSLEPIGMISQTTTDVYHTENIVSIEGK